MHTARKAPSLISFDSFEGVLARYAHRASAEELRGLAALEGLRQANLDLLRKPRSASGA